MTTAETESWADAPVRDCYTKVQGQPCGPRHGWASWLNTLYVCPGVPEGNHPSTPPDAGQNRQMVP